MVFQRLQESQAIYLSCGSTMSKIHIYMIHIIHYHMAMKNNITNSLKYKEYNKYRIVGSWWVLHFAHFFCAKLTLCP